LRGEKVLGDNAEEQEVEWNKDEQRRQIKYGISVQGSLLPAPKSAASGLPGITLPVAAGFSRKARPAGA
jgi:hypothetical protein